MIFFEDAHVAPRLRFRNRNTVRGEDLLQNADRREAAVIDRGAGPIENDGLQRPRVGSHHYIFISRIICSAKPNDSVMPEPPTAVTMRTPGAASIATQGFSGCLA